MQDWSCQLISLESAMLVACRPSSNYSNWHKFHAFKGQSEPSFFLLVGERFQESQSQGLRRNVALRAC